MPDVRTEDMVQAEYMANPTPELEKELYELLKDHASRLVWVRMRERQPEIVDGAVQLAMANMHKFKGESKFSTWFTRVTINEIGQYLIRKDRRKEVALEATLASSGSNTEDALNAKLTLEKMMQGLSEEERSLIEWKLAGETEVEIAERVGLTVEGVRIRWHRLRQKLR